jgi:hypothetical protein
MLSGVNVKLGTKGFDDACLPSVMGCLTNSPDATAAATRRTAEIAPELRREFAVRVRPLDRAGHPG